MQDLHCILTYFYHYEKVQYISHAVVSCMYSYKFSTHTNMLKEFISQCDTIELGENVGGSVIVRQDSIGIIKLLDIALLYPDSELSMTLYLE